MYPYISGNFQTATVNSLLFVAGETAAGKSYSSKLLEGVGFHVFESGEIMRGRYDRISNDRDYQPWIENELSIQRSSDWPGSVIGEHVLAHTKDLEMPDIAIIGPRSYPTIKRVSELLPSLVACTAWLDIPYGVRQTRFIQRSQSVKGPTAMQTDILREFSRKNAHDIQLGIYGLKTHALYDSTGFIVINNTERNPEEKLATIALDMSMFALDSRTAN